MPVARSDGLERLTPFRSWVERAPTDARLALLARCEALLGERPPDEAFAVAVELGGALPPLQRARTELLYGEWLRRERRRQDARRHLRVAAELLRGLRATPWEERAEADLRATGDHPQTRPFDARSADSARGSDRGARGRRLDQSRDRRAVVHQPAHGRLPPAQGVLKARDRLAYGARAPRLPRVRLTRPGWGCRSCPRFGCRRTPPPNSSSSLDGSSRNHSQNILSSSAVSHEFWPMSSPNASRRIGVYSSSASRP